jgi:hypothetical protein
MHTSRGVQVGIAAFVVNYLVDQGVGISHSHASLMFSFCQLTFMGGHFFVLLRFINMALKAALGHSLGATSHFSSLAAEGTCCAAGRPAQQ